MISWFDYVKVLIAAYYTLSKRLLRENNTRLILPAIQMYEGLQTQKRNLNSFRQNWRTRAHQSVNYLFYLPTRNSFRIFHFWWGSAQKENATANPEENINQANRIAAVKFRTTALEACGLMHAHSLAVTATRRKRERERERKLSSLNNARRQSSVRLAWKIRTFSVWASSEVNALLGFLGFLPICLFISFHFFKYEMLFALENVNIVEPLVLQKRSDFFHRRFCGALSKLLLSRRINP